MNVRRSTRSGNGAGRGLPQTPWGEAGMPKRDWARAGWVEFVKLTGYTYSDLKRADVQVALIGREVDTDNNEGVFKTLVPLFRDCDGITNAEVHGALSIQNGRLKGDRCLEFNTDICVQRRREVDDRRARETAAQAPAAQETGARREGGVDPDADISMDFSPEGNEMQVDDARDDAATEDNGMELDDPPAAAAGTNAKTPLEFDDPPASTDNNAKTPGAKPFSHGKSDKASSGRPPQDPSRRATSFKSGSSKRASAQKHDVSSQLRSDKKQQQLRKRRGQPESNGQANRPDPSGTPVRELAAPGSTLHDGQGVKTRLFSKEPEGTPASSKNGTPAASSQAGRQQDPADSTAASGQSRGTSFTTSETPYKFGGPQPKLFPAGSPSGAGKKQEPEGTPASSRAGTPAASNRMGREKEPGGSAAASGTSRLPTPNREPAASACPLANAGALDSSAARVNGEGRKAKAHAALAQALQQLETNGVPTSFTPELANADIREVSVMKKGKEDLRTDIIGRSSDVTIRSCEEVVLGHVTVPTESRRHPSVLANERNASLAILASKEDVDAKFVLPRLEVELAQAWVGAKKDAAQKEFDQQKKLYEKRMREANNIEKMADERAQWLSELEEVQEEQVAHAEVIRDITSTENVLCLGLDERPWSGDGGFLARIDDKFHLTERAKHFAKGIPEQAMLMLEERSVTSALASLMGRAKISSVPKGVRLGSQTNNDAALSPITTRTRRGVTEPTEEERGVAAQRGAAAAAAEAQGHVSGAEDDAKSAAVPNEDPKLAAVSKPAATDPDLKRFVQSLSGDPELLEEFLVIMKDPEADLDPNNSLIRDPEVAMRFVRMEGFSEAFFRNAKILKYLFDRYGDPFIAAVQAAAGNDEGGYIDGILLTKIAATRIVLFRRDLLGGGDDQTVETASTTESDRMRAAPQKLHPDPRGSENQRMEPVDEGGDEDEDEVDLR